MKRSRSSKVALVVLLAALAFSGRAFALHVCGDNSCDDWGPRPETCDTCPEDCGFCYAGTSTVQPVSVDEFIAQLNAAPQTQQNGAAAESK